MASTFTIVGRRWFQRTYGNTYHRVRIIDATGSTVADSGMRYGYGDGYLQTAWAMLQQLGAIPADAPYGGTLALRETYGIAWTVADVARKRDL